MPGENRFPKMVAATLVAVCAMVGKPASVPAQPLDEVLAQAYSTNPRLQAFRLKLRSTDEGVATAMSGWRPTLTLSANAGQGWRDAQGQGASSGANSRFHLDPRGDSVTLSENIYRGGRTVASVRQADYLVESDRASLLDTEQQVLLLAATAYMDVVRDQSRSISTSITNRSCRRSCR
jgi:outer membrane protein